MVRGAIVELIESIMAMVALVILGSVINRYLVVVPVALIQAALGLIVALTFKVELQVSTDWFMLLFMAPLLFNDGRHYPKRQLWYLRGPILGNAVLLVLASTLIGGWLFHVLSPSTPLAAAFALAAILSPTDLIAVQGLAARIHLPRTVLNLVSGESMINDASGLISFKYAVAAAVSGTFILQNAVRDFFYVSVVGLLVGTVLILLINGLRRWLLKQGINDYALHTVLQILTPFIIYFVADELLHSSGVIAVVIAGLLSNGQPGLQSAVLPELRLVSERTWDIVVYLLNGIIFVLLGMELPVAMGATIKNEQASTAEALLLVVLMYVILLVVRVAWLYGNMLLTARRSQRRGQAWRWPPFQQAVVTGISGVRGAITLIGVLSLPLTVAGGDGFPGRALILFVAAGVVILSLVVASIALPIITRERVVVQGRGDSAALAAADQGDLDDTDDDEDEVAAAQLSFPEAQSYTLQSAVRMIESERRTENQKPALDLLAEYQARIRRLAFINADKPDDVIPPLLADELNLRRIGLTGEQQALTQLWREGRILADTYIETRDRIQQRVEDIDRSLAHAGRRSVSAWFRHRWRQIKRGVAHLRLIDRRDGHHYSEQLLVEKETAKGGLKHLSAVMRQQPEQAQQYDRQMVYAQVVHYRNRIANAKAAGKKRNTDYDDELRRLRLLGFAAERTAIRRLMDNGYITTGMATKLSADVSYTENAANLADVDDAS